MLPEGDQDTNNSPAGVSSCFVLAFRSAPWCTNNSSTSNWNTITSGLHTQNVGWDSTVGIATHYRLDGPGIESLWRQDFLHLSRPSVLYNGYWVSFPEVKRLGSSIVQWPPSSAMVKEIVELYLYSPSGPSYPVLGELYLTFTYTEHAPQLHSIQSQILFKDYLTLILISLYIYFLTLIFYSLHTFFIMNWTPKNQHTYRLAKKKFKSHWIISFNIIKIYDVPQTTIENVLCYITWLFLTTTKAHHCTISWVN
jgi:hypothetical protein